MKNGKRVLSVLSVLGALSVMSVMNVVSQKPPKAEQQASPTALRDKRTMYSHTGQYDHILPRKQLYHVTHSLFSLNTLLRRIPCCGNLNIAIHIFIVA